MENRRPETPKEEAMSEKEIAELRRNLSLLSPSGVEKFYRETHKACELERKPGPQCHPTVGPGVEAIAQVELAVVPKIRALSR
jgi:hypothetical protein